MEINTLYGLAAGSVLAVLALNRWFNGGKNYHYPDLSGKVIIITGANTGIGFIAAQELAKLNPAKIIMACRSKARGEEAIKQIGAKNIEFMALDLNDLESVKSFAKEFSKKY
jgi:NAD(P)-dependent dehydrogenase (short-subunit alcohol dehydrogenase family)